MGLSNLLNNLASGAIKTVGDLATTVTYTRVAPSTGFDAVNDTPVAVETVVTFSGVLSSFSRNEYDYAKVMDNHLKLVASAKDMGFEPANDDKCEIQGRHYEVKRVKYVPGSSIYIIALQQV